jgi:signal transduction histidine kinase
MGRLQKATGLDQLPVANGGRIVGVFSTGTPVLTAQADQDPDELPGIVQVLGVRSAVAVPLAVGEERRGVLAAASARSEFFTEGDLTLLAAVSRWVGMVAHRAELVGQRVSQAAERGRRAAAEEVVAVLAHDLNNLLTPVRGRVQMLQRAHARNIPIAPDDIQEIRNAVDRLGRLVADLLDMQRLERGVFVLNRQPVDLAALARETGRAFSGGAAGVEVEAPETLPASADPERLRQALENLLGNAVKHSFPGRPVRLSVVRRAHPAGDWAALTVADDGPGIAPDLLPRLFAPFATGAGSSGLGLGLYIVRRIVALHGGDVTVESTPGEGTRFQMALPLQPTAEVLSAADPTADPTFTSSP